MKQSSDHRYRIVLALGVSLWSRITAAQQVVVTHGESPALGGQASLIRGSTTSELFPVGGAPWSAAYNPAGTRLYIIDRRPAVGGLADVVVLDANTRAVLNRLPVGRVPGDINVQPGGTKAYIPVRGSDQVAVLDLGTDTLRPSLPIAGAVDVAFDAAGRRAFVTSATFAGAGSGTGVFTTVDTATDTVTSSVPFPFALGSVAVTPEGLRAYVARAGYLLELDTLTGEVLRTMPAGETVGEVLMHPSGNEVYVVVYCVTGDLTCTQPGAIGILDRSTGFLRTALNVGNRPLDITLDPRARYLFVTSTADLAVTKIRLGCVPVRKRPIPTLDTAVGIAIRPDGRNRLPRQPCR